ADPVSFLHAHAGNDFSHLIRESMGANAALLLPVLNQQATQALDHLEELLSRVSRDWACLLKAILLKEITSLALIRRNISIGEIVAVDSPRRVPARTMVRKPHPKLSVNCV